MIVAEAQSNLNARTYHTVTNFHEQPWSIRIMFDFKREVELEKFSQVSIEYGVTAHFKISKDSKVTLEADKKKFLSAIAVEQDHNLIEIQRRKLGIFNDIFFWRNKWTSCFQVIISAPKISDIIGSYGSHLNFSGIEQREINITLDFGTTGVFHCTDVDVLHLKLSYGSSCQISGTCNRILLQKDSSSTLEVDCRSTEIDTETVVEVIKPA